MKITEDIIGYVLVDREGEVYAASVPLIDTQAAIERELLEVERTPWLKGRGWRKCALVALPLVALEESAK